MNRILRLGKYKFDLNKHTLIMGILNRTPDSFSDGGEFLNDKKALLHIKKMFQCGASIIDIGGESTRPGSSEIGIKEEIKRVIPLIRKISSAVKVPISIDTRHSEVAELALQNGCCIVNDVTGLKGDKNMGRIVSRYKASIILMHMRGNPRSMQRNIKYKSLIEDILKSLRESINIARSHGIGEDKIIIDPGIGFGKTVRHNIEILKKLSDFKVLNKPILVGTSRKSFIGGVLRKKNPDERLYGTIASVVISALNGADIVRVHDVCEIYDALKVTDRIKTGDK